MDNICTLRFCIGGWNEIWQISFMIKYFRFDSMSPWTQAWSPEKFLAFLVQSVYSLMVLAWIFLHLRHITRDQKPIFPCWKLAIHKFEATSMGSRVNVISGSWSAAMFGSIWLWYILYMQNHWQWNLCSDYEDTKFGLPFSFTIWNLSYQYRIH